MAARRSLWLPVQRHGRGYVVPLASTGRHASMSQLTYEIYGNSLIATFQGPLNRRNSPGFQEELVAAAQPARNIILDLAEVPDISGSGIRLLLHLYYVASLKGGDTSLVGLSDELRNTIEATGLSDFFLVCDSLDEALPRLRRPGQRRLRANALRAHHE